MFKFRTQFETSVYTEDPELNSLEAFLQLCRADPNTARQKVAQLDRVAMIEPKIVVAFAPLLLNQVNVSLVVTHTTSDIYLHLVHHR